MQPQLRIIEHSERLTAETPPNTVKHTSAAPESGDVLAFQFAQPYEVGFSVGQIGNTNVDLGVRLAPSPPARNSLHGNSDTLGCHLAFLKVPTAAHVINAQSGAELVNDIPDITRRHHTHLTFFAPPRWLSLGLFHPSLPPPRHKEHRCRLQVRHCRRP